MKTLEELEKENENLNKRIELLTQALEQSRTIKQKFNESTRLLKQKDKDLKEMNLSLEQKINERTNELEAEKNYINKIVDTNPNIIIVTNGNRILKANKRFFELFKYNTIEGFLKDHECICDYFLTLNNKEFPKDRKIEGKIWAKYILDNLDRNHIAKMKVEEEIYFYSIIASKLEDDQILVILTDITDLKQKEEQLHRSEKLASMGEMIGNIAHQWRQPLSVISTSATGLKLQHEFNDLSDEQLKDYCDIIDRNAQYLSKTIDDFKNYIKGDSTPVKFDLKNDTDSFLKLVEASIKEYHIQVILDLEEHINIKGYPNELIQCFINIFNNSKDALRDKKEEERFIFISQHIKEKSVIIEFKDNAGGIREDIIEKIFDPYFTTKHQSQGTGLGLHMVYNLIVNGMSGSVEAKNIEYEFNNRRYKGASFTIKLPFSK